MSLQLGILEVAALLAAAVGLGLLAKRIRLPVTVVLAVVGFAANVASGGRWIPHQALRGELFEHVLVLVFLPVLVFAAVLGLSVRAFFRNLGAILALAVVAMGISTALVGGALHVGLEMPLLSALVFGALISATDPVAVVAVFHEVGVPRRLLTLVEGESLLNDGAAIVLVSVLVAIALGEPATVGQGVMRFVIVFGGGVLIGAVLGLVVAAALPWLDRFAAIALSLALAYGGFVLAEEVLGFSGVMATVSAGLVVHGLAPSRASREVRTAVEDFWEALDFIGNAILFLLIGLVIQPALLIDNWVAIVVAAVVVLVARALAVTPVVAALERTNVIPRVGLRNQAVLVWGGLRGGVALALALSLPEELVQRDAIVAMTGGVVLATLLLNATTISALVRRLGLNRPTRTEEFLAASARLSAAATARRRLEDLQLEDSDVRGHLDDVEQQARADLERISFGRDDELQVIIGRGLVIERQTYQHLSDSGLLPPAVTRKLLHEVDDQIDAVQLGRAALDTRPAPQAGIDEAVRRLVAVLPSPPGEDPEVLAYAEASARRLAARRTSHELELFAHLPNVKPATIDEARAAFQRWEEHAVSQLEELDRRDGNQGVLRRQQAEALSRATATDALHELAETGLLPSAVAEQAAAAVGDPASS